MLTVTYLNKQISELTHDAQYASLPRQVNAIRNKVAYCRTLIKYLETNPDEDFIKKEIDRLTELIKSLTDRFWNEYSEEKLEKMDKGSLAELKRKFENKYSIPKHKEHLKNLKYIFDN